MSSPGWYCASGFYRPVVNPGGSAPQMTGTATDPDGNQVTFHYEMSSPSTGTQTVTTGPADSGTNVTVSLPPVTAGREYAVRARAEDVPGGTATPLLSGWSRSCEFAVNTTAPDTPTVTADETDKWYQGGYGVVRIVGSTDTVYFNWSDGAGKSGTVRAVAGKAAFLYGPIGSSTVALTVTARGATTTATQSATLTVAPIVRDTSLRAVWRFEELTGPSAVPSAWDTTAWNATTRPVIAVPVRIASVPGNAAGDDHGLELRGQAGFATAGPLVDSTAPMSVAVKVRGAAGTGVIFSQAASAGGDAYKLEAVMDGGVRKYKWTVTTSTGTYSVFSNPASTSTGNWDWVVVSTTPPSTTPGQLAIFTKVEQGFGDFDGPSVTLPVGAAPRASATGSGLQVGASYAGVIDDLNVWSGGTADWIDADARFAP